MTSPARSSRSRLYHRTLRSHGAFPDAARQRFWDVTVFRLKPGGGLAFEAAAKAYGAAAERAAPTASYRIYQVIAGMPSPTYLVFSSVESFADFDKSMADDMATFKAMTSEELAAIAKAEAAMVESETRRVRLSPEMSYVPAEVREQDPAFWKFPMRSFATRWSESSTSMTICSKARSAIVRRNKISPA